MTNPNEIIARVTNSTSVHIRANSSEINLDEPMYAINWFSTKMEWLYHFYNILAFGSVKKVGGKALFKGKITETILDENKSTRELLLIVRYPGGQNFKQLMESTWFKMVSIFRMLSVKKFTFGFTHKRIWDDSSAFKDNLQYAVHHFKTDQLDETLFSTFSQHAGGKVNIKYAGVMVAELLVQQNQEPAKAVPNLMDGLVIFEAKSKDLLREMFTSVAYQNLINGLDSSYIGLLNRKI